MSFRFPPLAERVLLTLFPLFLLKTLWFVSGQQLENETEVTSTSYQTPKEFMDLYLTFTGSPPSSYYAPSNITSVGTATNALLSSGTDDYKLILVTNAQIGVYQNKARLAVADTRTSVTDGFYEVTAVSHVGTAMMYLAAYQTTLNAMNDDSDELDEDVQGYTALALNTLKRQLEAVREYNQQDWIAKMNADLGTEKAAWVGTDSSGKHLGTSIREMINYAATLAITYIDWVLLDPANRMSDYDALNCRFLKPTNFTGNVGYDDIMVATFSMVGLSGAKTFADVLGNLTKEDWEKSRIVLQNFAGSSVGTYNFGNMAAGLDSFTNYLHPLLVKFAERVGADATTVANRIVIPAYANILPDLPKTMSPFNWTYYTTMAWSVQRTQVAQAAMPEVTMDLLWNSSIYDIVKIGVASAKDLDSENPSVVTGPDAKWPGDYFSDPQDNHGGTTAAFMARCRYSFTHTTEFLSSTVLNWVVPAYIDNNLTAEGMTWTGLTGIDYPVATAAVLNATATEF